MLSSFFQDPDLVLRYFVLTVISVFSTAGAVGYRRIAVRGLLCLLGALVCGVALFSLAALISLMRGGRAAEGAAMAAILLGLAVGAVGAVAFFLALLWRFVWRDRANLPREQRSLPFAVITIASFVLLGLTLYSHSPRVQSDRQLVRDAGKLWIMEDPARHQELIQRGREAVPEIIAELRAVPDSQVGEFESGLNGGIKNLLLLLGKTGGAQAIAELRSWLTRPNAAADVRAVAALALAEAGDQDSSGAIARLLSDQTDKWRKQRPFLYRALARLKASSQTAAIAAAVLQENDPMFQMDGVAALVEIDGTEGWRAVDHLLQSGSPDLRAVVVRVLEMSPASEERDRLLSSVAPK